MKFLFSCWRNSAETSTSFIRCKLHWLPLLAAGDATGSRPIGGRVCSVSTNERPSLTGILGEEGPPSQGDRYSQDDHIEPSSNEIRLFPNMTLSGRKIFIDLVRQNVGRDSDVKGKKHKGVKAFCKTCLKRMTLLAETEPI